MSLLDALEQVSTAKGAAELALASFNQADRLSEVQQSLDQVKDRLTVVSNLLALMGAPMDSRQGLSIGFCSRRERAALRLLARMAENSQVVDVLAGGLEQRATEALLPKPIWQEFVKWATNQVQEDTTRWPTTLAPDVRSAASDPGRYMWLKAVEVVRTFLRDDAISFEDARRLIEEWKTVAESTVPGQPSPQQMALASALKLAASGDAIPLRTWSTLATGFPTLEDDLARNGYRITVHFELTDGRSSGAGVDET